MSTTIDQRVVEMQFDNSQFETNVKTSMSTLDKLKESLNLSGASQGLENVSNAAKNCDVSPLSSAVETISVKFSALEVMAIAALSSIATKIIETGTAMVSALTIDPITTGLEEYETKINAIQTIMSNTASDGVTMEDVTEVLDELNTYADKTIYNFAEMTRNIGTFTAAGVELDAAAQAIQGIANLAASSGSTSTQASTAMYQLSQALATGTVKLQDWNSVVNAGMGGELFQDALKETAREYGIAVDDIIDSSGSFRDSLAEGWITADVLNTTLEKFTTEGAKSYSESMMEAGYWTQEQADALMEEAQAMEDAATKVKTFTQLWDTLKEAAQSGWSQSWEIVIGDFEEAKELFTEVNDVLGGLIGTSADARNEMLQGWKDLDGRTILIEALKNAFEGIVSVITPIKEAFTDIFPPITSEQLVAFTEGLRDLTAKMIIGDTTSENLKNTFSGLFAILDIVRQALVAVFNAISPLFSTVGSLTDGVLSVTGSWGEWLVALDRTIEETNIFSETLNCIIEVLTSVKNAVVEFISSIIDKYDFPSFELFHSFLELINERMEQVGETAGGMKSAFVVAVELMSEVLSNCKILSILSSLWDIVKTIGSSVIDVFKKIASGISSSMSGVDFNGLFDFINSLIFGGLGLSLTNFITGLDQTMSNFTGIFSAVKSCLNGVKGCLVAYQEQLKAGTLTQIATAIAILAGSILVISLIDSEKLSASLGAMTVLFADLMVSMSLFSKISGELTGVTKSCTAMISISIAMLLLASALKTIGELDFDEMVTGLVGVAGLTATMVAATKVMSSNSSTMTKGATQMVIIAAAIKVLASACEDLSSLDWDELTKGLVGVSVLMAEIVIFLKTTSLSSSSISTATSIVIVASAIKILASACEDFSQLSWESLAKGLSAITILLVEIVAFVKLTNNTSSVISTGIALIALAASMKIFASAIQDMSTMEWEEIGKGLVVMAGALAEITIALNFMPTNMVSTGVGLIAVATAMLILSNALITMGDMTWDEIAKGLAVLGVSLTALSIALNLMTGTLSGSAALLVATTALAILVPTLAILGAMSWEGIAKGLVAIAGAFTVIGIAAAILSPLIITIVSLSGALALIGVGVLALGVGLVAAGAGLSGIAIGLAALVTTIVASSTSIVAALTIIVIGIIELIPAIATSIGEGIIEICKVLVCGVPSICETVRIIIVSVLDMLLECVPLLVDGAFNLIITALSALVQYTPTIVTALFQFLIGVLDGIAQNLPGLIQSAVNVIMSIFTGIYDALCSIDSDTIIKGITSIGLLTALIAALAAVASLIPSAMLGVLGMGVVIAELALVLAAIGALEQIPGLTWLVNEGSALLGAIGTAIGSFIGGIVGGFLGGVSSQFPQIGTDLSAFILNAQPFIDGAKNIDSSVLAGVQALGETILILTAANVVNGLTSWFTGGSSMAKFGEELAEFGPYFNTYYNSIKGIDGSVIEASSNAALALGEMASKLPNSGGIAGWFMGENSLSAFAEELTAFGPKLKTYANSVQGLDSEVVVNSANAALALAEMASKLPDSGGVVGWFMGENSLSTFAQELAEFGPILKNYAASVSGLDAEIVVNSANAALALAEMANNLPNQGGAVGWFVGENSLSVFAEELSVFGPKLKSYADSISGLDAQVIINSANAAKALSELANNLPNQGGMVSWFTGDNDIGTFGESLIVFGEKFSKYSDYMKTVDSTIVTSTANAAKSIVALQESLPKEGGWFSDEMTLASFGDDMASFGYYFNLYYEYIKGVNTTQLNKVIAETEGLVELARGMSEVDTSGMANFGISLAELGEIGVNGFIKAFTDANSKIVKTATDMLDAFIEQTNSYKQSLADTFTNLIDYSVEELNNKTILFSTSAKNLIASFVDSVKDNSTVTINAFETMINSAVSSVSSNTYYNKFYSAGKYMVQGFANGISAYTYLATAKSAAMASAAVTAAEKELDINSPSKVSYGIGGFFGTGFVNALSDYATKAYDAGTGIAKSAKDGLNTAINNVSALIDYGIDDSPTIRPVLDLTEIQNGKNQLYSMMNSFDDYSLSGAVDIANKTSQSINSRKTVSSTDTSLTKELTDAIKTMKDSSNNTIANTFNITGTDSEDIANKVSRKIQQQVNRKGAVWA